ncbi:hypothetical protein [Intestinimonas massiliensis (ex Afouda et al. 2020)]|nr:hypothetical protein [Intestinimonas massiliensis (ex Afouda et al. 2020)]
MGSLKTLTMDTIPRWIDKQLTPRNVDLLFSGDQKQKQEFSA